MKCRHCGAEIGNSRFCEFCGAEITSEDLREREKLNKAGCPACGSTNVAIRREDHGVQTGRHGTKRSIQTVAVCGDCGNTWYPNGYQKPRKTWLWVLGWIFLFPLPLTLILLKKKDMQPPLRYGLIAAGWVAYLLLCFAGRPGNEAKRTVPAEEPTYFSVWEDEEEEPAEGSETEADTEEETETEEPTEATEATEEETEEATDAAPAVGIRPEVKDAIDSYERFVDEYCAFMENYDANDFSQLARLSEMVMREAEMTEKFDALEDDLTDAELDYYTAVSLRCSGKLMKAAYAVN